MDGFYGILSRQAHWHPSMEPADALKLCYQAAFGAEHMLSDRAAAQRFFDEEYDSADPAPGEIFEPVSEKLCRGSMAQWRQSGLPGQWLFNMFLMTAEAPPDNGSANFKSSIDAVDALAREGGLPFLYQDWRDFMADYEKGGVRPVHHSEGYRLSEKPKYRLVSAELARLLELLKAVCALPGHAVVAIDGRAAAGKSTVADALGRITGAGVIHMDDFFLPQQLRTPQRLGEPGGNVHYERFISEVLPRLSRADGFSYRRFDCEKMSFSCSRLVPPGGLRIVEGAYSCHPALGGYMDLRVFADVSPAEQRRRILARNGEAMAAQFESRWIPMEEQYFSAFGIRDSAQLILGPEV